MSFCSDDEEINDCQKESPKEFGRRMRRHMLSKHYDDLYDC